MSKPICLIKIDNKIVSGVGLAKIQEEYRKYFEPDYFVIVVPMINYNSFAETTLEPIQLEVFYEKDFEQKDKDYILNFVKTKFGQYEKDKSKEKPEPSY